MQRQTVVTAHFLGKQLLLLVFIWDRSRRCISLQCAFWLLTYFEVNLDRSRFAYRRVLPRKDKKQQHLLTLQESDTLY